MISEYIKIHFWKKRFDELKEQNKLKIYKIITSFLVLYHTYVLIFFAGMFLLYFILLVSNITGERLLKISIIQSFGTFVGVSFVLIIFISFPARKLAGYKKYDRELQFYNSHHYPIFFLNEANKKIQRLQYDKNWVVNRKEILYIMELINYSLKWTSTEFAIFGVPRGFRFDNIFLKRTKSRETKIRILKKVQGLNNILNDLVFRLALVNSQKGFNEISKDLEKTIVSLKHETLNEFDEVDLPTGKIKCSVTADMS